MVKQLNPEFDYTLEELKSMEWSKSNFENGVRTHVLGEFDGDTQIALNDIIIYEKVKIKNHYKTIRYHVYISADLYGEFGIRKQFENVNLREVKKSIFELIANMYENDGKFMKKRNME